MKDWRPLTELQNSESPSPENSTGEGPVFGLNLRAQVIVLLFYAAVTIFGGIWVKDISTANEGQRAYPPIEMLQTGDWVVPRLNGEDYLKKPPLLYWQIALTYKVLGISPFTARLTSGLAGIGIVLIILFWMREFATPRASFLAALMTASNILILDKARQSHLDIHLGLFALLAAWCLWRGLKCLAEERPGATRAFLLVGLWTAIANMYKFPVPYLFLAAPLLGAAIGMRRWKVFFRWEWLAAGVVSIVPIVLWGWAVVRSVGWEHASGIWLHEAELRAHATEINSAPIWFYFSMAFQGFLPWSVLWFVFLSGGFRRRLSGLGFTWPFLWVGTLASLIVLTLTPAKESEYMNGAVPYMTMMLGLAADEWFARSSFWPKWSSTARWRLVAGTAIFFAVAYVGGRVVYDVRQQDDRTLRYHAEWMREEMANGRPVVIYKIEKPQLYFYLRQPVPIVYSSEELQRYLTEHPGALVFSTKSKAKSISAQLTELDRIVYPPRDRRHRYAFAENDPDGSLKAEAP